MPIWVCLDISFRLLHCQRPGLQGMPWVSLKFQRVIVKSYETHLTWTGGCIPLNVCQLSLVRSKVFLIYLSLMTLDPICNISGCRWGSIKLPKTPRKNGLAVLQKKYLQYLARLQLGRILRQGERRQSSMILSMIILRATQSKALSV